MYLINSIRNVFSNGAIVAVLVIGGGVGGARLQTSLGLPIGVLFGVMGGLLLAAIAFMLLQLLRLVDKGVRAFSGKFGVAALFAVMILSLIAFFSPTAAFPIGLGIFLVAVILLKSINILVIHGRSPWYRGLMALTGAILSLGAIGALVCWLYWPGEVSDIVEVPPDVTAPTPILNALDPGRPGSYAVKTLTYGAGNNRLRPEFSKRADVVSRTVDARAFVTGLPKWQRKVRSRFWGFGPEAYGLNGHVWYPDASGKFPLVLVVHGDHDMADFSDRGYGYLGRHLASRGYLVVSIDENFLNRSFFGGIPNENDARAWILLEHLRQWHDWNADENSLFFNKVDITNIALIGHSRGGEAVYHAATFNKMDRYPDDTTISFDYGYKIKGLVAIAPTDGQYRPGGRLVEVSDVNYLVIQGGHDGDSFAFLGDRQYNRVRLKDETFKASVYVYRANHSQFNSSWGQADWPLPMAWLGNRRVLMASDAQRQLALVYITAFLDTVLKAGVDTNYRDLFRDQRVGRSWLPDDLYVTRYEDGTFRVLADFEEDVDVSTTTAQGGRISTKELVTWRERDLGFRYGREGRGSNAVFVGWRCVPASDRTRVPQFEISLPRNFATEAPLDLNSVLTFQLAAGKADARTTPAGEGSVKETCPDDRFLSVAQRESIRSRPIDFNIELITSDGTSVRLPLSDFRWLLPPLTARVSKGAIVERGLGAAEFEPVLQTFELPLKAFADVEPKFHPSQLAAIRFTFDVNSDRVIIFDRIGFSQ